MEDKQFEGYQKLRSTLEFVIEKCDWTKEDLREALTMLEEDGEEYFENKE